MSDIIEFTFKGKSMPLPKRWKEGWQDGYDHIVHNKPCPFDSETTFWGNVGDGYGNGYAEGMITGRVEMMRKLYLDHWPPQSRPGEMN